MGRAEDIFNRIESKGQKVIDEFILVRRSEELFLEFKRSSNNGQGKRLSDTDRNNLAKAISGFGNSEGGVLVWGVDCSEDLDYADVAKAKFPIQNVKRFVSWLEGAVSGCTVPPHPGVRNRPIPIDKKGNGFVVTYIPKSNHAPHQVVGKLQYYMRAGSDFVPVLHGVLAGMFGRRPQPSLYHKFYVNPAENITETGVQYSAKVIENSKIKCQMGFLIGNQGPGIAKDVFINAAVISVPWEGEFAFFQLEPENWVGRFSFGRHISLISKPEIRVPPGSFVAPFYVETIVAPPFSGRLQIKCTYGCADSPPFNFRLENTAKAVESIRKEFLVERRYDASNEKLCQDFTMRIFNLPSR